MAWVEFRLNVLGEEQVARAFEASARDAADMSEPLGEIGDMVHLGVAEQFRTEGVHGLGSKWKPLDQGYAAWKRRQVGEEPILVFTGAMRATLLDPFAFDVGPKRMVYRPRGEHDDVAAYHQGGDGDLPQRKIVAITQLEKRQMERAFLEWLRRDPLRHF